MNIIQMQQRIDAAQSAADSIAVAQAYLDGAVLRDMVAAEAWLMRAVEMEDPLESTRAMGILAERILGKEPLSEQDCRDIRADAETARGREREALLALLELASSGQKAQTERDN